MHQHDQELIMALAEATLDADALRSAQAEIAACAQCTADLELQQFAIEALSSIPRAMLTEMESARLRRDVRNRLGLAKESRFEPTRRRRRMPMAALATAAAVLIAVVVAAPALNLIGGSNDDATETVAVAAETTLAPATTRTAAAEVAPEAVAGDNGTEEFSSAQPQTEDTRSPTTTDAPTETIAAATTTAAPVLDTTAFFAELPDLVELRNMAAGAGYDEQSLRAIVLGQAGDSVIEDDPDDALACINVTMSGNENYVSGFQIARGTISGRDAIYIVYVAEDIAESALVAHAADNCEVLATAGP